MPSTHDFNVTNPRALLLLNDVAAIIGQGRRITIPPPHDRLQAFGRYLNNNKRHMAMTAGSLGVAATLATPIFVLAAVTKVVIFGGGAIIGGFQKWKKGQKYRQTKQQSQNLSKGEDLIWKRDSSGNLVYDPAYGEQLINDVKYLLERQGLTDIYNAFANLDGDFSRLNAFLPGTFPPKNWRNDPEQDVLGPRYIKDNSSSTDPYSETVLKEKIKSSDDAVELWETVCWLQYRYQQVAEAVDILQEFVEYIAAVISMYDVEARTRSQQLWNIITKNGQANAAEVLTLLNRVVNERGVQTHFGRKLGRQKDYRAWAYSVLPDFIQKQARGLQFVLALTNAPEKLRPSLEALARAKHKTDIGHEMVTELSGFDLGNYRSGEEWGNFLMQTSVNATSGIIQDRLTGDFTSVGASALGSLNPGVQGVVEAATTVATEVANKAWEEYQLSTGQTRSLTNRSLHQQTIAERIGLLRNAAKGELEDYVGIMEDWKNAYDSMVTTGLLSRENAAEALLRFYKCENLYYRNRVGQMHQETMYTVIQLAGITEKVSVAAAKAIEIFLRDDEESYVGHTGTYYYGSLSKALREIGFDFKSLSTRLEAKTRAVKRIEGPDLMEEMFPDKSRFLSNDLIVVMSTRRKLDFDPPWALGIPNYAEWKATGITPFLFSFTMEESLIEGISEALVKLHYSSSKSEGKEILETILKKCNYWLDLKRLSKQEKKAPVIYMKEVVTQKLKQINVN